MVKVCAARRNFEMKYDEKLSEVADLQAARSDRTKTRALWPHGPLAECSGARRGTNTGAVVSPPLPLETCYMFAQLEQKVLINRLFSF